MLKLRYFVLVALTILSLLVSQALPGKSPRRDKGVTSEAYAIKINTRYYADNFHDNLALRHTFPGSDPLAQYVTVSENLTALGWNRDFIVYSRRLVHRAGKPVRYGIVTLADNQYYEFKRLARLFKRYPAAKKITLKRPQAYYWHDPSKS